MRLLVCTLLVACAKPAPPPAITQHKPLPRPSAPVTPKPWSGHTPAAPSGVYGTAHPLVVRAFDRTSSRWMALCQAREDTDHDGKVEVQYGHHGEVFGDALRLYFAIDGGEGTRVDHIVDTSLDDRWVVLVRDRVLELVDTASATTFELADADIASDNRPGTTHRAARFANKHVLFIRHRDAEDAIVIHDLATHTEREVTLGERVWRFGLADEVAEVYTIPRGGDFPQLSTTLAAGECTGPPASSSTHGQRGSKPTQRFIDLASGVEVKSPATPLEEPPHSKPVRMPDPTEGTGPVRWR